MSPTRSDDLCQPPENLLAYMHCADAFLRRRIVRLELYASATLMRHSLDVLASFACTERNRLKAHLNAAARCPRLTDDHANRGARHNNFAHADLSTTAAAWTTTSHQWRLQDTRHAIGKHAICVRKPDTCQVSAASVHHRTPPCLVVAHADFAI